MSNNLVAIVTGGAKRIGAAIVATLHQAGYNVLIHYNQSDVAAEALANTLNLQRPNSCITLQYDLNNCDDVQQLVNAAESTWQRLDLLVNNASSFYATPVGEFTESQWNDLIASNLKGPTFLAQAAAPLLAQYYGCIISIIDIHAWNPLRNHTLYNIAKAGLAMMTKSLAKELSPEVRVNAVAPGPILWPDNLDDEMKSRIVASTLLKRQGSVAEVANAVLYLAAQASYTTGHILPVDGGRHLK